MGWWESEAGDEKAGFGLRLGSVVGRLFAGILFHDKRDVLPGQCLESRLGNEVVAIFKYAA